ncbi:helix-turn-helix domain-containing protein [Saccharothrix hoggarensis]|uniref:Helix-turn-helix domain-containing protein n=1 Tax=Saccharothrix hoggarensis TaxID=913853 RepID=A0ABW3QSS6_9PSEU
MVSRLTGRSTGALDVLELLANEAPMSQVDDLVRRARDGGAPPEAVDELLAARALAQEVRELFGRRRRREAGLSSLLDIARELILSDDLNALLSIIPRRARLLVGADAAYLTHYDRALGHGRLHTADGLVVRLADPPDDRPSGPLWTGPVWTPDIDAGDAPRLPPELARMMAADGVHALVAASMHGWDHPFGTLYVADRGVRHFSPDEVSLLTSLAALVAVAVEQAQRVDRATAAATHLQQRLDQATDEAAALDDVQRVQSTLTALVLRGADLATLTGAAAEALQGALLVLDPAERVIAATCPTQLPAGLDVRTGLLDAHTDGVPRRLAEDTWIAPITVDDRAHGGLVLRRRAPLDDAGVRLLRAVAQNVALVRMLESSAVTAEGHVREELLDDLLIPTQRSPRRLTERARRLSLDLSQPHVVVVARPEGGSPGRALVWASSYAYRAGGLAKSQEGCVVLLLPGEDAGAVGTAVSAELSPLIGQPVSVGAAGPTTDLADIPRVHREAVRCLDVLTLLDTPGRVASPRELGFLGVLLSDDHDVDGFVDSTLGPVVNYDREHYTELTRTLEAYVESGGSPTYAAETLYVHPNTVSRRLTRIAALLGADWQTPSRSMEIQLALKLRRTRKTLLGGD